MDVRPTTAVKQSKAKQGRTTQAARCSRVTSARDGCFVVLASTRRVDDHSYAGQSLLECCFRPLCFFFFWGDTHFFSAVSDHWHSRNERLEHFQRWDNQTVGCNLLVWYLSAEIRLKRSVVVCVELSLEYGTYVVMSSIARSLTTLLRPIHE